MFIKDKTLFIEMTCDKTKKTIHVSFMNLFDNGLLDIKANTDTKVKPKISCSPGIKFYPIHLYFNVSYNQ